MPSIQITTPDVDLISAVVAFIIDEGYDASFTVNLTDTIKAVAVRTATETGRQHLVHDAVYAIERAERDAHHAARYTMLSDHYDEFNAVPCPHCSALPGWPCQRPNGSTYPAPFVHARRVRMATEVAATVVEKHTVTSRPEWMDDDYPERAADEAHLDEAEAAGWIPFDDTQPDYINNPITLDEM